MIDGNGTSFADFRITVADLVDGRGPDGNGMIAVRGEMRGTHVGEMFGVAPSGRQVGITVHEFHEVKDGRLARTWHLEDWFGFVQHAGTGDTPADAESSAGIRQ